MFYLMLACFTDLYQKCFACISLYECVCVCLTYKKSIKMSLQRIFVTNVCQTSSNNDVDAIESDAAPTTGSDCVIHEQHM